MNIPEYIRKKGAYKLHKKYGLAESSLSVWSNKESGWKPSALIQLAFMWIRHNEGDDRKTKQNITKS